MFTFDPKRLLAVCLLLGGGHFVHAQPPSADAKLLITDARGDPLPRGAVARLGTVRLRHDSWISGVVFAPDGKSVFSGASDGMRRWDIVSGKEIQRGPAPNRHATHPTVARTVEGNVLVANSYNRHMMVWSGDTGKKLQEFGGQDSSSFTSMRFSNCGKMIATADHGDTVGLWDAITGKEIARLTHPKEHHWVVDVAFRPDSKVLATRGLDGMVLLWDTATHKEVGRLATHRYIVGALAFSADGKTLLTDGSDETVRLWDVATGKELHRFHNSGARLSAVALSPDGKILATADVNNNLWIWDTATEKRLRLVGSRLTNAISLSFSPDCRTLASAEGPLVRVWDVATGKDLHPDAFHKSYISGVAFSSDGAKVVTGSHDGTVSVWDLKTRRVVRTVNREDWIRRVWFLDEGKLLGWAEGWNKLAYLDLTRENLTPGAAVPVTRAQSVGHFPNGQTRVEFEGNDLVLVENAAPTERNLLKGHRSEVSAVACSRDGKTIASLGTDGMIHMWDVPSATQRLRFDVGKLPESALRTEFCFLALSQDGKWLACSNPDTRTVGVWDTASGKRRHDWKSPGRGTCELAFSPDGSLVSVHTYYANEIDLWELNTGKHRGRLSVETFSPSALAFSPDSRLLAVGQNNTTVVLWPVESAIPRE